jgi:hypothetical protein
MWLWSPQPRASTEEITVLWQACLRRFDLEHTFRFIKSRLGWNKPLLRDPAAADRWTWLIIACYAQLYLARPAAAATRLPCYDKREFMYQGTVDVASIRMWLRDPVP